jgi:hypothetical protein
MRCGRPPAPRLWALALAAALCAAGALAAALAAAARATDGGGAWRVRGAAPAAAPPPAAAADFLQLLLGGPRARANPWRAAFVRARLDWHDLVPVATPGRDLPAAAAALQRHQRDDAKAALLALLQNAARGGGAAPVPGATAQERLLAALRAGAAGGDVLPLLARPEAVARAALVAGVAADDVDEQRAPAGEGDDELRGCAAVRDKCLLHGTLRGCLRDSFCGWCAAASVCVTRGAVHVRCAPRAGAERFAPAAGVRVRGAPLAAARDVLVVAADTVPSGGERTASARGARRNCSVVVREHPFEVDISGDSKMAYHWATETLPKWMTALRATPGGARGVDNAVLLAGEWNELLAFANIFTRACPRAAAGADVARACFAPRRAAGAAPPALAVVDAASGALVAALTADDTAALVEPLGDAVARGLRLSADEAAAALADVSAGGPAAEAWLGARAGAGVARPPGLAAAAADALARLRGYGDADFGDLAARACGAWWDAPPAPGARPLVVLVSRLNKRLLLNEPDLVRVALALGADVRVAALETMSVCAQVRLFQQAAVVVGVHGSALINSIFMRRGAAILQIVPYRLEGAAAFFESPAAARGVRYVELAVTNRSATTSHDHFLKDGQRAEDLWAKGSSAVDPSTFFTWYIKCV